MDLASSGGKPVIRSLLATLLVVFAALMATNAAVAPSPTELPLWKASTILDLAAHRAIDCEDPLLQLPDRQVCASMIPGVPIATSSEEGQTIGWESRQRNSDGTIWESCG